jgi:hypothetical protein
MFVPYSIEMFSLSERHTQVKFEDVKSTNGVNAIKILTDYASKFSGGNIDDIDCFDPNTSTEIRNVCVYLFELLFPQDQKYSLKNIELAFRVNSEESSEKIVNVTTTGVIDNGVRATDLKDKTLLRSEEINNCYVVHREQLVPFGHIRKITVNDFSIQTAVEKNKHYLEMIPKVYAFLMSKHKRLGMISPAKNLCSDIIETIVKMIAEEPDQFFYF